MLAQGVWINVMCLAHQGSDYGVLIVDGEPLCKEDIAAAVGGNPDVVIQGLDELESKRVIRKRESDGAYYVKRMVEDEQRRQGDTERKQAERRRKQASGESLGDVTDMSRESHADVTEESHPTRTRARPSSSSSPSPTSFPLNEESGGGARAREAKPATRRTNQPEPRKPTLEQVKDYAGKHSISAEQAEMYWYMRERDDWYISGNAGLKPIHNWQADLEHQWRRGHLSKESKSKKGGGHAGGSKGDRRAEILSEYQ